MMNLQRVFLPTFSIFAVTGICLSAGCTEASDSADSEFELSVSTVVELYADIGINCDTASKLAMLRPEEQVQVANTLLEEFGTTGMYDLLDIGGGCEINGAADDLPDFDPMHIFGQFNKHISNTSGLGEWIEEESFSGGSQALGIYRDGASAGWMCNGGSSEWPADFIALFSYNGAYAEKWRLSVRGTTPWAWAYIPGGLSSRVYSDNHVASCIGYWSVFLTGSIVPLASELRITRQ